MMTCPLPKFVIDPDPNVYLANDWVCLDLETTNHGKGVAHIESNKLIYGLAYGPTLGQVHIRSLAELAELGPALASASFMLAHNAKFELQWLMRAGVDVSNILVYDTQIGEYIRAGNRKWKLNLNATADRYSLPQKKQTVKKLIDGGICPSCIPLRWLEPYCQWDVYLTIAVMEKQRQVLKEANLLKVFFNRCFNTPVISEMEYHGLFIDKELLITVANEVTTEHRQFEIQLNQITGGINLASAPQKAEFIYETLGFEELRDWRGEIVRGKATKKFPDGQPKTDVKTLDKLTAKTKAQKQFIYLYKKESQLRKQITTYLNKFINAVENTKAILHGKLNQTVVATHRLSSSEPNLQNIARKLKKLITARFKDWKIANVDYAQLEFRTAGIISNDPQIVDDVLNNADIHSYTASIIFREEWEACGGDKRTTEGATLRQGAKEHTFKPLYGGRSGTERQQEYYAAFREKYKVINTLQTGWTHEVLMHKQLTLPTGLIMYWPDTKMKKGGYITNTQQIFDYPVQNLATAEIAQTGIAILWHNMKAMKLKSFLINEIHDSGLVEIHPKEIEVMRNLFEKCLSKDIVPYFRNLFGIELFIPLEVEYKICDNWDYDKEPK